MLADESYKRKLLSLYLRNKCTPKELEEVMLLLKGSSADRMLLLQMQEDFSSSSLESTEISTEQANSIRENLRNMIEAAPVIAIKRKRWQLQSIAAAVAILISLGTLYFFLKPSSREVATNTEINKNTSKPDVDPGSNKAVLTLADGTTIVLDDAQNGNLAQQGNTKVIKLNGKLNYDASGTSAKEVMYNTIATPRGGQFQIELPDGSQVWLNAASSLRFPTAFIGKERRVEITGEAYFEVAKNSAMPFIVKANNSEVKVLGTHFNIMSYNDESMLQTTLLEGSVKVSSNGAEKLLRPGQQSRLKKDGSISVVDDVDVDNVVAWKNGLFNFEGENIESVCRQLSRWYDVDIEYSGKIDDLFFARIPKDTKLSKVLDLLQRTGKVHFKIEGKKLFVQP